VNGDGYSDVIVGASEFVNGHQDEGAAFIYLGGATGMVDANPASAASRLESNQASAEFGTSVASAGDVNGDGYGDVIVGARDFDNGQGDEGAVFVYHGSAGGLSTSPDWFVESNQDTAQFGCSASSAGDVNGDGYSDVIVGAWRYDGAITDEGGAFVYHGGPNGLSPAPDWISTSGQTAPLPEYGFDVASAGDVNSDGYSDVIVGSPHYRNGQSFEGRAFVFLGSDSGLASTAVWFTESNQENGHLGEFVTSAGDVNGDGYSDVMMGGIYYTIDQFQEGRVWLHFGSPSGPSASPSWISDGNQVEGHLGWAGSGAGDVNGDGYSDVVLGHMHYSNGQSQEGRVRVYTGASAGPGTNPAWVSESGQAGAWFGAGVDGAGDVNGDGFADIVVGAPYYDGGQTDEGTATLFYGNGAKGLSRVPRQMHASTAAPIALLSLTDEDNTFELRLDGRTPAGRGDVRLEWEIRPLGVAFDGTALDDGVALDSGAPEAGVGSRVHLDEIVTGLVVDEPYHWRARIVTGSPFFPRSPWFSVPGNGRRETDLRTHLAAECAVAPDTLSFGTITVGADSVTTFTIENTGGGILSGIVTEACADFEIVGDASYSLTAGEIDTITVRFAPTSEGPASCTIAAGSACADVAAIGAGFAETACAVSVDTLSFGTVAVGSDSLTTFTIENTGGGTLSGTVTEACGDFEIVGDASYSLTAGQVDTITVRFAPTSEGPASCAIVTGSTCADVVAIGTGFIETACAISVDTLSFGMVAMGAESVMTFTIENAGGGTLSGTVTEACADFEIVGDAGYGLAAGEIDTITVRFAPTSEGPVSCAIETGSTCANVIAEGTAFIAPTGVDKPGSVPREASLSPTTPNPFCATASITFAIPRAERVTLAIYDVSGRLVRSLVDTTLPAAWHNIHWDGADGRGARVAPGIYFCELRAGSFRQSRQMVLAD
jgi:hypothetical protein